MTTDVRNATTVEDQFDLQYHKPVMQTYWEFQQDLLNHNGSEDFCAQWLSLMKRGLWTDGKLKMHLLTKVETSSTPDWLIWEPRLILWEACSLVCYCLRWNAPNRQFEIERLDENPEQEYSKNEFFSFSWWNKEGEPLLRL